MLYEENIQRLNENKISSRKIGKFFLDRNLVLNNTNRVAELFSILGIVPVRCEFLVYINKFEYIAISDRFEEMKIGYKPLEYEFIATQSETGSIKHVEVVKVEGK